MNTPQSKSGKAEARKETKMNETNGNRNGRFVLGPNTLVPLSLTVTIIVAILAGAIWLDSRFDKLELKIANIEWQITKFKEK